MTEKPEPVRTNDFDDLAGLNNREQAFVLEYMVDLNATQAAIRAGYSEKTASAKGSQLFRKVSINAAIKKRIDSRWREKIMTADEVQAQLSMIGRFSMKGIVRLEDGAPVIDLENMTDDQYAALSEVVLSDDGKLKVKAHSKVQALGHMAKIHGLLKDKIEVELTESAADIMTAAMERSRRARAEREGGRDE